MEQSMGPFNRLPSESFGSAERLTQDFSDSGVSKPSPRHSAAALQAVMDSIPALIYVADMQSHKVLYMNRLAKERFGDAVGRICWQSFHADQSGPCPSCNNSRLIDARGVPTGIHTRDCENPHTGQWLECREQVIRWLDGQWARMQIAIDISARKHMEEDLRLAARACETTEGIVITDTAGTIVKVNAAFTRITGFSAAEALGANPRILKSDRNAPSLYHDLWASLLICGEWSGEIWNRRKDGEVYPEWLNITAVRNEAGNTTHYVGHFQDISERKGFEARIEYQALYDALTDLPNRRLLLDRLEQRLCEARRHGTWGGLLFLDLDNFKDINDRLGHLSGDMVLREAAQRISQSLRKEDTAARFGGDEFIALLNHLGDDPVAARSHLLQVAEKIRHQLLQPLRLAEAQVEISPSIGATLFHALDANVDHIIHRADQAMYQAKQTGKNQILFMDRESIPNAI